LKILWRYKHFQSILYLMDKKDLTKDELQILDDHKNVIKGLYSVQMNYCKDLSARAYFNVSRAIILLNIYNKLQEGSPDNPLAP